MGILLDNNKFKTNFFKSLAIYYLMRLCDLEDEERLIVDIFHFL